MKVDLKKSRLGRILRRLAGERKGAVMLEYVMLGVLIAAAVIGGAFMIANVINNGFKTIGTAASGGGMTKTLESQKEAQKTKDSDAQKATEHAKNMNGE